MGMRTDCKHYQSRTYGGGEAMQACDLDAAPDAPWRCPENCVLYEKRELSRVGWDLGSLKDPADVGSGESLDEEAEATLAEAEAIVTEALPDAVKEWQRKEKKGRRKRRRKGR